MALTENTSMSLPDLVTKERALACMSELRKAIAFYRMYPDIFVDDIKGPECSFRFYSYQREFLRVVMRHKWTYAVFPRAFSKSFLTMMSLMLKCILYPGTHAAVTTGGKEQAASITLAKIDEICTLIPNLEREINWDRGKTTKSRDNVKYTFKNGSTIDILAARESSRGQRRHCVAIEEAILVDGDILNEIIVPTTNIDRMVNGKSDSQEVLNQSQTFITTAGWKNTFPYDKLIETLINSVLEPDKYMVLGGTFDIPVKEGLLAEDFIDKLRLEGTFNESSFDREYRSIWEGDALNGYFSSDVFDKHRQLLQPEKEYSGRTKNGYYILGIDVGRVGCNTEVCVIKITPQPQGASLKAIVNLFSFEAEHFGEQSIYIKKLFYRYKCRCVAIDANGIGAGLVDFMTTAQIDPETGDELPPFGITGGSYEKVLDDYKKINKVSGIEKDAMYLIKASLPVNDTSYTYIQTQMSSGKVKFLINEREAGAKLMNTKVGQNMTPEERNEYLRPFVQTTILKEQMLNLVASNDGFNTILKQNNRSIPKDKFSAFQYGMYYAKVEEDKNKKRKSRNISDFVFFS